MRKLGNKAAITKREKDIYNFVVEYRNEKHFSPSMRVIAAGVGLFSVSTVCVHIHKIAEKGWFYPYDGTPGSIVPTTQSTI